MSTGSASAPSTESLEQLARHVMDAQAHGTTVIDPDGVVIYANDAAARMIGRPLGDFLGRSVAEYPLDLIRPDGSAIEVQHRPGPVVLRTGGPVDRSVIGVRHDDGTVVWAWVSTRRIELPDGRIGATSQFVEVTDSFVAQQQYRMALGDSVAPTWLVDGRDFTILKVNESFCSWLGYRESEVVGVSHLAIIHPDDQARVRNVREQISRWQHNRLQVRFRHADGSFVHGLASAITVVDPNTARLARLVTAIDTSEQMAVLAKLSESNHRFDAMFRNSIVPSAILDLVVAPGRILAANGALATTVGQRAEQLRMVPVIHLLCHDDRTSVLAGLDELALGVSDHATLDVRLYGRQGECVPSTMSLATVLDAHGRPTSAIAQFALARRPATLVLD